MVVVVGIAAGVVCGTEPPPADANTPQTLSEYLQYAVSYNAGLKAMFEEWKAASEQVPQAKALPDPTFTYNYFVEQVQARQQVGIMQMFPWFGKIEARTDAAAAAAQAARKRFDAKRLQLFFEVKEAFHEYLYLANAIRIAKENLDLAQHFDEVARAKYITAAASHPDIIRAQIKVAELQNDLVSLERLREPIVARLNAVLNRPAQASLPWPRHEAVGPIDLDRPTLIASLRQNNPQLQALGFDVERLTREVDLAKKNFYPDVGLGVERMDMVMGDEDEVIVGVELNLPIWRRSY
jgi:outer membrane protein TolC